MKNISYISNFEEWKNEFNFSIRIKVRFAETDMFGHVNNTTAFTYFEEGRLEFFKKIGIMRDWMSRDSELIPVVADLQCDYLSQIYFDDVLQVFVKMNKVGRTSVELHYLVKKENGTVAYTGRGTIVQINKETGRPEEWKEHWKELLYNQSSEKQPVRT
ncbi:acyl-CoA thioester hydrolase [Bacillus mesophilus]|uniref:Acyl-CoA thioesterase n=1 Tax=Bacillus mesophilus TaxID=1808955 RepID=A0A6M0Q8J0_9BACI|nr:thioesterase family protein [Bacillus mesophilus]MBM7660622.1 acyl-CoA thioester hydrolase [Bacillus mesophilus]NEY71830.1 acyl-CoA thioesterase [Bacillus mesophilus]